MGSKQAKGAASCRYVSSHLKLVKNVPDCKLSFAALAAMSNPDLVLEDLKIMYVSNCIKSARSTIVCSS
jgi:hypothetical protein